MDRSFSDGGSAGNAINKVFEAGLDTKKLKKVNDLLKQSKTGINLNFADKGGKFAGVENFFNQLEKLKKLGDNDILKTEVFKELFGTDKENHAILKEKRNPNGCNQSRNSSRISQRTIG